MQPKKFSEYTPITETDGSEVIPILKAGVNATVKSEDLPISTATQTAIDAADADIAAHIADVANPHEVTKAQVGLGNVDNTSDINKPVSTAQAAADAAVASTAASNLSAHTSNTSNPHSVTKSQVGLGNADNTSDVDKPISAATQTALDGKATKLDIPQYSVPYKSTAGTGEANANLAVRDSAATPGSIATRDGAGAIHVATATATTHAVNKAQMETADALKVSKSGDTMTGTLTNTGSSLPLRHLRGATGDISIGTGNENNFIAVENTGAVRLLDVRAGRLHIGDSLKPAIIHGTGFPNGIVTAPVGSIYIDTAVTNGASSWIKKSGTGNTGWQVLEGDTGWRDIASLVDTVRFNDTVTLRARIRRVNSSVELMLDITMRSGQSTTTEAPIFTSGTTLTGFRPSSTVWERRPLVNTSGTALAGYTKPADGFRSLFTSTDAVRVRDGFMTPDDWPTTLPGTAA